MICLLYTSDAVDEEDMLKFWHNLSFYAKRLSQARVLLLPKVLCIFNSVPITSVYASHF